MKTRKSNGLISNKYRLQAFTGSPQQTFVHPYKSLIAHAFATIISEIPRTVRAPRREIDLRDRERNEEREVQLINPFLVRHLLYGRLCDAGFK